MIARRFSDAVCNRYHQLVCEEPSQVEEESVEIMWTGLKSNIEEALEVVVAKKREKGEATVDD